MNRKILLRIFASQTFNQITALALHVAQSTHCTLLLFQILFIRKTPFLRRFTQRANLDAHLRIHSGYKPHACDFCGKSFSQKGNMEEHRRVSLQKTLFRTIYETQLSNLLLILNSASHCCDPAMRTRTSRQFSQYSTTYL